MSVIPVEVIHIDKAASLSLVDSDSSVGKTPLSVDALNIWRLEIVFCKGFTIYHYNINYTSLKILVEKLEVIC